MVVEVKSRYSYPKGILSPTIDFSWRSESKINISSEVPLGSVVPGGFLFLWSSLKSETVDVNVVCYLCLIEDPFICLFSTIRP